VTCRVLGVSRSGYYEWVKRPPSKRDVEDAYLLDAIIEVHAAARAAYGVRRVHAELVLGRSQDLQPGGMITTPKPSGEPVTGHVRFVGVGVASSCE
jgi:hypothetical protein